MYDLVMWIVALVLLATVIASAARGNDSRFRQIISRSYKNQPAVTSWPRCVAVGFGLIGGIAALYVLAAAL